MLSHYDVLEVAPEATEMEVRKQYQLLALKLHPDKPAGDHKKFTQLQEAWTVLADPHQRAEYDLQLKRDLLYQQYPISEELFLEDLHYSCDEETTNYSHVCRCGGRYSITEEELLSLIDSEVAISIPLIVSLYGWQVFISNNPENHYPKRLKTPMAPKLAEVAEVAGDLAEKAVDQAEKVVGQAGEAVGLAGVAAGQAEAAEGQAGVAAGQAGVAAGQAGVAVGLAEMAVDQAGVAAGLAEVAVGLADEGSPQASAVRH
ncbi:hypothetical protein HAZT_HAZT003010 [Hyalella azteca]|uniref:J domain-containing protein n=1 Tax=Hyalella azteca TaxID=294128 RepID=A0A6A0H407_HYAAZ|nr:hypothetical protein HAZT_HAZT003010 [Hyalella azteca]